MALLPLQIVIRCARMLIEKAALILQPQILAREVAGILTEGGLVTSIPASAALQPFAFACGSGLIGVEGSSLLLCFMIRSAVIR